MKETEPVSPRLLDVYIGTYTEPHPFVPGASGEGIIVCSFDCETGKLERRQTQDVLNPSYLALDHSFQYVIAVSENFDSEGMLCLFLRQPDGRLAAAGSRPSGGVATCHVCATPGGEVCTSSYLDGGLAIYLLSNGTLGDSHARFRYQGKSVNPARQEASHAHQAVVSPDSRWIYVCDLGTDCIWRHSIIDETIADAFPDSTPVPQGSGPRHMVFHPKLSRAYVVCELNAHLLTYHWDAASGCMTLIEEHPSLPQEWTGQAAAAAIRLHPSGAALYISNRNHNSVAVFQIDQDGSATISGWISSGGETPRDIAIDPSGRWLMVANQSSGNIVIYSLDVITGLPVDQPPSTTIIPSPACILLSGRIQTVGDKEC